MKQKQIFHQRTAFSVATTARIPNALYDRFERFCLENGASKTDVICAALRAYLPHYDEKGEGED